jgi:hypothetical protein
LKDDREYNNTLSDQASSLQETQALPMVFVFAEGFFSGPQHRKSLPRAALGNQKFTALPPLPRSGRRQARTLGIIKTLPIASPRHGVHRRRRSERRHIWAAVHCADRSAVGPSAQMPPVPSAAAQLSAKALTRVYPG